MLNKISENERFLPNIFASIPDGLSMVDENWTIVHVNPKIEEWYASKMPLVGKKCYEVYCGNTAPCDICPKQRPLPSYQVVKTIMPKKVTNGGTTGWFEFRCFPIVGADTENINGIVECIRDITDWQQRENALEESEKKYHALFENAILGNCLSEASGKIVDVNPAFCKMFGYSREEILRLKTSDLYTKIEDRDHILATLAKENQIHNIDLHVTRKDGTHFWGSLAIERIELSGKQYYLSMGIEATEKKLAQEALKESEQRYRMLFEANLSAVVICTMDGKILEANPAFFQMSGFSPEDLKTVTTPVSYVNPNDRIPIMEALKKDGYVHNVEVQLKRGDGSGIWVLLSVQVLEIQGEKRTVVIANDISEKRRAEIAMKELYEKTRQVSEMKTNLITFAAHELKTPLTPIIGWMDVFKSARQKGLSLDEVASDDILDSMLSSASRLDHIINNFLDVDRLERGRIELQRSQQSLAKLMENAVKNALPLARNRNTTIINEIQDANLYVDPVRIEEVFLNILTNAIKYSPENSVVSIASFISGDLCCITIIDQGFGFSEDELRDAWRPFSKSYLRKQALESVPGTGVGLYLAKSLTEQHGGCIEIDSNGRNKGTTVTIYMPLSSDSSNPH